MQRQPRIKASQQFHICHSDNPNLISAETTLVIIALRNVFLCEVGMGDVKCHFFTSEFVHNLLISVNSA